MKYERLRSELLRMPNKLQRSIDAPSRTDRLNLEFALSFYRKLCRSLRFTAISTDQRYRVKSVFSLDEAVQLVHFADVNPRIWSLFGLNIFRESTKGNFPLA